MKSLNKYNFYWPLFFILPFIICFFLFTLFPILYSFSLSMVKWSGIGPKEFVGPANYLRICTKDTVFWKSVWNTVRIGIIGFPLSIILGLVLAVVLHDLPRCRKLFQTVNFLPYITTPVAIGLIFMFIFDRNTGFINKLIVSLGGKNINWTGDGHFAPFVVSFMILWKCTGYYMAMYLAGITSISEEIYDAAKIDGAGKFKIFQKITVPLLRPITRFLTITSIIYSLQLFDEPNLLFSVTTTSIVGGPDRSCLTTVWNFYDTAFGSNPRLGYGSAMSCVLFVLITVISIIGLKIMTKKEEY